MGTKSVLAFFATFFFFLSNAQPVTCDQREAIIRDLVKSNKLANAYDTYADRGKCEFTSNTSYVDIEKLLTFKIDNSKDEEKVKLIKELSAHYDNNDKLVPSNGHQNKIKKAMLLQKHKTAEPNELYALLDAAYKGNPSTFNEPKAIYLYFSLFIDRYKDAKNKISDEQLFDFHDKLSLQLRKLMANDEARKRNFQSVQSGMRSLMVPLISCPKLTTYYGKKFETGKDDPQWLESATMALLSARCTSDSLFTKAAYRWYEVSPNANSAYHAGLAAMRKNDKAKAVEMYSEAANLEKDPEEKSRILYTVAASLVSSDKALAFDYVKKALAARPSNGKAYLLMAQIFAGSTDCAKNDFERKALNILASQTALKAMEVDPGIKPTAERQSELFLKRGPTSEEIKKEKMSGKSVSFGCWINTSVTIPKA